MSSSELRAIAVVMLAASVVGLAACGRGGPREASLAASAGRGDELEQARALPTTIEDDDGSTSPEPESVRPEFVRGWQP